MWSLAMLWRIQINKTKREKDEINYLGRMKLAKLGVRATAHGPIVFLARDVSAMARPSAE